MRGSTLPLTPEWSNFFMAELGALAALTGFVVVAISINLTRILAFAGLPGRAAESLILPMGAITATGVILVPEQASLLVGSEILAIGLVTVVAPIVIQVRSWSDRKEVTAVQRILRFVTSAGLGLAFGVGRRAFDRGRPRRALLGRGGRHRLPGRRCPQRVGADGRDLAIGKRARRRGKSCGRRSSRPRSQAPGPGGRACRVYGSLI